MELLKQEPLTAIPKQIQVVLLALPFITFFNNKNKTFLEKYKKTIIQAFLTDPQLSQIAKGADQFKTDDELIKALEGLTPILQKICP